MTDHLMRQTKFALPMFAKTPAYFYLYFYFILLYKSQFRASIGRALIGAALGAQSRNKFYKMDYNKCYTYVHASHEMTAHLTRQTTSALPMFAKTPAYFYLHLHLYLYFYLII